MSGRDTSEELSLAMRASLVALRAGLTGVAAPSFWQAEHPLSTGSLKDARR